QLTESQFTANRKAGGMDALFYVNQILNLLNSNSLDLSNDKLMTKIKTLRSELSKLTVVV
ncbi:hypothetical protein LCGC14_2821500, partial [marine sediment metagenome]